MTKEKSLSRTKPILRWPGGKSRMLKLILPKIPPHVCYDHHAMSDNFPESPFRLFGEKTDLKNFVLICLRCGETRKVRCRAGARIEKRPCTKCNCETNHSLRPALAPLKLKPFAPPTIHRTE